MAGFTLHNFCISLCPNTIILDFVVILSGICSAFCVCLSVCLSVCLLLLYVLGLLIISFRMLYDVTVLLCNYYTLPVIAILF